MSGTASNSSSETDPRGALGSTLAQLQLSERQASLPAEHLDKRQPHNNCSARRWHNDSKEKEVSVDDQTLSSIPSQ